MGVSFGVSQAGGVRADGGELGVRSSGGAAAGNRAGVVGGSDRARSAAGHHTIIAGIDAEQAPSVGLHEVMGFERVALLREVGFKFGRWLHVIYMQRMV